jgi:streptogramin lyase
MVVAACPMEPIRDMSLPPEEVPEGCTDEREGCLCDALDPVECADTGPGRQGTGECAPGLRYCIGGIWGACEGELQPGIEDCDDGLDNDCDGTADEGSPCDCADGCSESGAECFEGAEIVGLVHGEGCDLKLATREEQLADAWIANTIDATVSRIDTVRGVEVARYPAVDGGDHGAPALTLGCDEGSASTGNCPSRTAVAPNGDAFVANRAFGAQGTLTKIAGRLDRCVDRDGDGAIETSQDLDGDGVISTFAQDGEYLGTADECLLWTVAVGNVGDIPRALAIAPGDEPGETGNVWVGLYDGMRAVAVDPETGATLASVPLDLRPYGAAAARDGRVWFTETVWRTNAGLQSVDDVTHEVGPLESPPAWDECTGSYGIALDEVGRVWRGGAPCLGVQRFDPDTREWRRFVPDGAGESVGVASDGDGHVWAVYYRGADGLSLARVQRIDVETGEADREYDLGVIEPWGVGLDGEGDAWVVAKGSDRAVEVDLETGLTRNVVTGSKPYTYSDFTGQQLYQVTDPAGTVQLLFEGCEQDDPTEWYDVRALADVPAGARVSVWWRSADDAEALASTEWNGPSDEIADARAAGGRLLEVRVELAAGEDGSSPVLHDVRVAHSCPDVAE